MTMNCTVPSTFAYATDMFFDDDGATASLGSSVGFITPQALTYQISVHPYSTAMSSCRYELRIRAHENDLAASLPAYP